MPVCTLSVDLIAAVLTSEERPKALAFLGGRLSCPHPPYFRPYLDLCLRVGTKVEIPRGVVLLPGIGRNHNNGFSFSEPEDRSGSALAALPPSCSEENDWASHRAAENPSPRQPIDCSMERVEETSGSQFPQQHIPEAVQSPHAPILLSSVFNTDQADKVYILFFCADSKSRTGESRTEYVNHVANDDAGCAASVELAQILNRLFL